MITVKYCANCHTTYRVANVREPGPFQRKRSAVDGLQPWCRACDQRYKITDRHQGWNRFRHALRNEGAGNLALWSEQRYFDLLAAAEWRCFWCGAEVTEWGAGYWIDRISSLRGYHPANCRPCCWACNRAKSNRNPEAWRGEVERLIEIYGRGKIPWDVLDPHIRHTTNQIPDLSEYVVGNRDRQLLLPGAA